MQPTHHASGNAAEAALSNGGRLQAKQETKGGEEAQVEHVPENSSGHVEEELHRLQ